MALVYAWQSEPRKAHCIFMLPAPMPCAPVSTHIRASMHLSTAKSVVGHAAITTPPVSKTTPPNPPPTHHLCHVATPSVAAMTPSEESIGRITWASTPGSGCSSMSCRRGYALDTSTPR